MRKTIPTQEQIASECAFDSMVDEESQNSPMHNIVHELRAALEEMIEAHSMKNIGLEASKRRLEAIKRARLVLEGSDGGGPLCSTPVFEDDYPKVIERLKTENAKLRSLLTRAHQYLPAGSLIRCDVETERPWR